MVTKADKPDEGATEEPTDPGGAEGLTAEHVAKMIDDAIASLKTPAPAKPAARPTARDVEEEMEAKVKAAAGEITAAEPAATEQTPAPVVKETTPGSAIRRIEKFMGWK